MVSNGRIEVSGMGIGISVGMGIGIRMVRRFRVLI